VSEVILDRIHEYRDVLGEYSRKMLPHIDWEVTSDRVIQVRNETDYLYRYFDATPHAEFLFSCVQRTIEKYLPEETEFLEAYDRFRAGVRAIVEMPDSTIDLLFRFLRQHDGTLSERAREREFSRLRDEEVQALEALYRKTFESDSR
jgi:hypothetical protein